MRNNDDLNKVVVVEMEMMREAEGDLGYQMPDVPVGLAHCSGLINGC